MKKVWKYIILTLLMLLGLCCVGVLYLFFIPNSSLFNITYINHSLAIESDKYNVEDFSTIEINSRAYDISFVETNDNQVYAKVFSNSFGFVLTKNQDATISSSLINSKLTFNITEPHGFATIGQSRIEIYVPSIKALNISLTNYKANATIDMKNLQINKLTYSTQKGDMLFKNGNIVGDLSISLNKGSFSLMKTVATNNNNVNLSLTSGKFEALHSTLGAVTVQKNANGRISLHECSNFVQNQLGAGGQINITNLGFANIRSSDTIVTINSISDGAIIDLNKSGKININTINGISSLYSNSGSIVVNQALSVLTLKSNSGNITVNSAVQVVSVNSTSGNVIIHFADEAQGYTPENQYSTLYAKMKDGSLTATGVEHVGDYDNELNQGIYISGNCQLNINFRNIVGKNTIHAENGSIYTIINKSLAYDLTTSSKFGSVRVNLTQTPNYNGYTTKEATTTHVNCETSENSLKITSNRGSLTVLDTNFSK